MRPAFRKRFLWLSAVAIALGAAAFWQGKRAQAVAAAVVGTAARRVNGPATVEDRLAQYGEAVKARVEPELRGAGVKWPVAKLTLIALKEERQLELWAANADGQMRFIKSYPIQAASGCAGPKLREGDEQVPEGIYAIESLNPNSRYHLSLRVNYPNATDRAHARAERRTNLGGDIMIHGKAVSIGCLAMGDSAAEELFVMAALAGVKSIRVLLCPGDLRVRPFPVPKDAPAWTAALYGELKTELEEYRH